MQHCYYISCSKGLDWTCVKDSMHIQHGILGTSKQQLLSAQTLDADASGLRATCMHDALHSEDAVYKWPQHQSHLQMCATQHAVSKAMSHDHQRYLAASLLLQVGGEDGEGVGVVLNLAGLEIEVGSCRLIGHAGEAQHTLLRHHTSATVLGTHHQAQLQEASILGTPLYT